MRKRRRRRRERSRRGMSSFTLLGFRQDRNSCPNTM
jgi:hypothetical protein